MTKASISFVILILLAACEKQIEKPKPIDRSVLEYIKELITKPDAEKVTLLALKYEVSDTVVYEILENYLAEHFETEVLSDRDSTTTENGRPKTENLNNLIATQSSKYNIRKRTVASIIVDYMLLYDSNE